MNEVFCFFRRKGHREDVELDDAIPSQRPGPDTICQRAEIREIVGKAIIRLPASQRLVIELKELQGFQYHEIAKSLNLSIGTVMSRLFYAKRRLQSVLRDIHPGV